MSRLFALVLALATFPPGLVTAQSVCEAPLVMLTVDKSSSMLGALPSGLSKWDAATMAIGEVTTAFGDDVDFGLQVFPYPNRCEPGAVVVDPGRHDASTMLAALGEPPPSGGNFTPMAQTLDVIADYAPLLDPDRDRHLVLVTDGWQWCDPHDPATRFTPVDSVMRLSALGITVHVVGFGSAVDSLTLNRAALAAGTALPGCDPTLSDPSDPNQCYHQANDLGGLRGALEAIARDITEELCDGYDNDCDGLVDEGYDVDADGFSTCGADDSTPGTLRPELADCNDAAASVHPGAEEVCDGLDNDCDGAIDPGCDCTDGDTHACGTDIGACLPGFQLCVAGVWGACEESAGPTEELCDGVDDDCDGLVDEGSPCGEGSLCVAGRCEAPEPVDPEPTDPPAEVPSGAEQPPEDGGCGCSTPGRDAGSSAPVAVALLLLMIAALRTSRFD